MRAVIPGPLAYHPAYHSPGYPVSTTDYGRARPPSRPGFLSDALDNVGWMMLGFAAAGVLTSFLVDDKQSEDEIKRHGAKAYLAEQRTFRTAQGIVLGGMGLYAILAT